MANKSFKHYVKQEWGEIPLFMIYAVLEWVLIIILFIDGFLAFIANEFAKFFEMKIPCLLCTRIDHVLVHRNADFYYNDSICETHKKGVSYLAYCHVHKRLSDIRMMCEGCLLSFATEKESDCDTYKSLVGILQKDIEMFVDDESELHMTLPAGIKDDPVQNAKISFHRCSCCGESSKVKPQSKGKKGGFFSHAPAPSPRASFGMMKSEESQSMDLSQIGAGGPMASEAEDMNEDKTPGSAKGNKFFGIPLDSANVTPRWTGRIQRKQPLEKTEYALDSAELNVPSEVDGDSVFHPWGRQIRKDRKSLIDLCMELDEERNASAVAANNAMAMITRLQQEKAAVQMEALQYQRMMEEQAEYDEEDLQATKDLLSKREDEIKVLEAELDAYRLKYGILTPEAFIGTGDVVDEDYQELQSHPHSPDTERSGSASPVYSCSLGSQNKQEDGGDNDHSSSLQEEKGVENLVKQRNTLQEGKRRLGRLKNLDKKSQLSSENLNHIAGEIERGSRENVMRELTQIQERLKALETGDGFSKRNGSERVKFLSEISENLQKLLHSVSMSSEDDHNA